MAVRWAVRDHRGRTILLFDVTWQKIAKDKQHLQGHPIAFERDMKRSIRRPLLVHDLRATKSSRPRWAYYTCVSDPNYAGLLLMTIVKRRPKDPSDVVVSAYTLPETHGDARRTRAVVEVGTVPAPGSSPCGDRRYGLSPEQITGLEALKRRLGAAEQARSG